MNLFQIAALVLFVAAGIAAAGWFGTVTLGTTLALLAFGLACLVAATIVIRAVPR